MSDPIRKKVQHFNVTNHAHLLTFSCYQRRLLLTNDTWRAMLSTAIDRALEAKKFELIAFVYMPEHVHLLAFQTDEKSGVDELLFAIKRPFSFRIKTLLQEVRSPLLNTLTVRTRPGQTSFRYWQEGGG